MKKNEKITLKNKRKSENQITVRYSKLTCISLQKFVLTSQNLILI